MLEHGGNLREAQARFGGNDWLDLSTGLNPNGYPVPSLPPALWHRLPEPDPALEAAASSYYGAPHMLAVAGTQAAIQALPRLRAPSRVTVAAPSYAEHAQHWSARDHGHTVACIAYADLAAAINHSDVVVICNPNNPTGETLPALELRDWAVRLGRRGGWLVVDEAFADTAPELSVASHSAMPGLIVLRSLGKFFGLAGIRLGFVGAEPSLLDALADLLGPWTVSAPAQQIGLLALRDQAWQSWTLAELRVAGIRLQSLLGEYAIASHGTALFQWWAQGDPEAFWRHMAERRIWVRQFQQAGRGIRLGLPADEAGWSRLKIALTEWTLA